MNKTIRLFQMMHYINNKEHFKISELMSKFNISRSTVFRDIEQLEQIGLPIYSEQGRSGGFHIIRKNDGIQLNLVSDEISALTLGLTSLENTNALPFDIEYKNVLNKIYRNGTLEQKRHITNIANHIKIHSTNIPQDTSLIEEVLAYSNQLSLYSIIYKEKKWKNLVYFVGLIFKNNIWYAVVCKENSRKAFILRVDKINSIEYIKFLTNEKEVTINNFEQYLFDDSKLRFIQIKCTKIGLELLENSFFTYSSYKRKKEYYIFEAYINDSDFEFIAKLLSNMGSNIKVLTPHELVDNVKRELVIALEQYY